MEQGEIYVEFYHIMRKTGIYIYQHGKQLVCPIVLTFTKRFCHKRATARSNHKPKRTADHQERHDQIDRGKGGLTNEVRYEKTVDHTVDGGEHHHDHGWHGEAQQLFICKMF